MLQKDTRGLIDELYLPTALNGIDSQGLYDPEKMKKAETGNILDHWRSRQLDGQIPIRFRNVVINGQLEPAVYEDGLVAPVGQNRHAAADNIVTQVTHDNDCSSDGSRGTANSSPQAIPPSPLPRATKSLRTIKPPVLPTHTPTKTQRKAKGKGKKKKATTVKRKLPADDTSQVTIDELQNSESEPNEAETPHGAAAGASPSPGLPTPAPSSPGERLAAVIVPRPKPRQRLPGDSPVEPPEVRAMTRIRKRTEKLEDLASASDKQLRTMGALGLKHSTVTRPPKEQPKVHSSTSDRKKHYT